MPTHSPLTDPVPLHGDLEPEPDEVEGLPANDLQRAFRQLALVPHENQSGRVYSVKLPVFDGSIWLNATTRSGSRSRHGRWGMNKLSMWWSLTPADRLPPNYQNYYPSDAVGNLTHLLAVHQGQTFTDCVQGMSDYYLDELPEVLADAYKTGSFPVKTRHAFFNAGPMVFYDDHVSTLNASYDWNPVSNPDFIGLVKGLDPAYEAHPRTLAFDVLDTRETVVGGTAGY